MARRSDKPWRDRPLKELLSEVAEHPETQALLMSLSSVAGSARAALRKAAKRARTLNAGQDTVAYREGERARRPRAPVARDG